MVVVASRHRCCRLRLCKSYPTSCVAGTKTNLLSTPPPPSQQQQSSSSSILINSRPHPWPRRPQTTTPPFQDPQPSSLFYYRSLTRSRIIPQSFNDVSHATNHRVIAHPAVVDEVTMTRRGSECYQLAMDALRQSLRMRELREERLLKEQFEAMERQRRKIKGRHPPRQHPQQKPEARAVPNEEKRIRDRAAGMAVVRTIVQQSQKLANNDNTNSKVDRWGAGDATIIGHPPNNNDNTVHDNDEEYWHTQARKYMEESALRYGYGLALVRLGNDALERAKEEEEAGAVEEEVLESTSPFFVDVEKCTLWIDESPIKVATILDVNREMIDDGTSCMSHHRRLALLLYAEAGRRGSAEGYYNHGHLLWDASKFSGAMESFFNAIKLGDADAMYFVAAQYLAYEDDEESDGGENNDAAEFDVAAVHERHGDTVVEILQKANEMLVAAPSSLVMAHPIQQHGLALLHHAAHEYSHGPALHHFALLHNEHGNMHDFGNYLAKAANMGHPDSLFLRGHCLYFGTDGFVRDVAAAMADFMAAAESGHVDAMVSAGALLHRGVTSDDGKQIVIERDQRRAFELYQQAGELGSMEGWRNVVKCYATGEGVPLCMDTAKYIANTMLKESKYE